MGNDKERIDALESRLAKCLTCDDCKSIMKRAEKAEAANKELEAKLVQEHENFLAVHRDNMGLVNRNADLRAKLGLGTMSSVRIPQTKNKRGTNGPKRVEAGREVVLLSDRDLSSRRQGGRGTRKRVARVGGCVLGR